MMRKRCGLSLSLVLYAIFGVALPVQGQAQKAAGKTYVLKAARLFDGKSNALVTPGVVVVTDGKIVVAGTSAAAPAGAEVIDLGDATLLPGFIDAHTHLTAMHSEDYKQNRLDELQKTIAERALDASVNARVTLMAGITTVRDVGSSDYLDVGLRNAIRNGRVPGPRMLVTVHALSATGGHCDFSQGFREGLFGHESGPLEGVVNGVDQARYAVRLDHKYGADMIKVCATGGVLSETDDVDTPQLTQEELNAIVDEAHALRLRTAAHAHGAEGAKRAIRAGISSIEHGSFLDDEALEVMKQRGTYLVPTLMAGGHRGESSDVSEGGGQRDKDRIGDRCGRISAWAQRRGVSPDGGSGDEADRCAEGRDFHGRGAAGAGGQDRHAGSGKTRGRGRGAGRSGAEYPANGARFFCDEGRRDLPEGPEINAELRSPLNARPTRPAHFFSKLLIGDLFYGRSIWHDHWGIGELLRARC